ncbi:uncharacterized protein MONBRDRAFT_31913 [Monosiga brevicollis MX1]|uniref:Uncharacterized protein n=1 Tax=Monosiga brevicollis TaxID=81824 RepID=A9UW78_MONBE|nr:uncharacterized protein MONBRDRAFT_31913 [Monosiga brevicollis MX1]EDQ90516.1 predicted protein [Monosiga brevicollis MX1]|eukprot:XP_001744567.1 hypothetical protein [Monosiga brevicollis MX1]
MGCAPSTQHQMVLPYEVTQEASTSSTEQRGVSIIMLQRILEHPRFKPTMTTADVCRAIIMPESKKAGCAYAALPEFAQDELLVGRATHFVSHAWAYSYNDLVDALAGFAGGHSKQRPYFWVDLMLVDQNNDLSRPHQWWSTTFKNSIQELGHTVAVMMPYDAPKNISRAWVLWELFCTLTTGTELSIAFHPDSYRRFRAALHHNLGQFMQMVEAVDAEKSEAFDPSDREQIHRAIREEIGFTKLNAQIRSGLLGVFLAGVARGIEKGTHTLDHARPLLEAGANPNMLATILTPLAVAAGAGLEPLAELLFSYNVEVNRQMPARNTALHVAALEGQARMVQLLLAHGADATKRNGDGLTAQQAAQARINAIEALAVEGLHAEAPQQLWRHAQGCIQALNMNAFKSLLSMPNPPEAILIHDEALCLIFAVAVPQAQEGPLAYHKAASANFYRDPGFKDRMLDFAWQAPLPPTTVSRLEALVAKEAGKRAVQVFEAGGAFRAFVLAVLAAQQAQHSQLWSLARSEVATLNKRAQDFVARMQAESTAQESLMAAFRRLGSDHGIVIAAGLLMVAAGAPALDSTAIAARVATTPTSTWSNMFIHGGESRALAALQTVTRAELASEAEAQGLYDCCVAHLLATLGEEAVQALSLVTVRPVNLNEELQAQMEQLQAVTRLLTAATAVGAHSCP